MDGISTTAAVCAGWAMLGLVLTGCFGDAPATDDTTTGTTTSSGSTDATTSTTDPTTTTTAGTITSIGTDTETTTVDPTLADSSTTTTTSEGGSSTSGSDTEGDEPTFFDDFERDDAQALGNGWVEKLPAVFSIDDGMVAAGSNMPQQYFDQVVYQQDSVVSDIELRVEFRIDVADNSNEPHLVARQQDDALPSGEPNHCYILVPQLNSDMDKEPDRLCLMRFDSTGLIGESRCTDWPNADLVVGEWYRLVMTIEGPGPVEMTGRLEHVADGVWTELVAVEWVDNAPNQIAGPGAWGFSGGTTGLFYNNYVFDNFSAYY